MNGRPSPLALLALVAACGYQPLYASPGAESYHVHLAHNRTASAAVAEEVLRGAREALAKEGALAPGDGFPRLEIEVLRADETSEGVLATDSPTGRVPRASSSELAVVARGWVARSADAPAELDTGDLRTGDLSAVPLGDATREIWQREDSRRAVARRLGGRIALKILGHPVVTSPSD